MGGGGCAGEEAVTVAYAADVCKKKAKKKGKTRQ